MDQVVVVGSGPAGLACAAEVVRHGVPVTVLEKGDGAAAAWRGRYDRLRFNTSRGHSAFPGEPFPRAWGQFPTRDQYVGYLDDFARAHRVQVTTGVTVERLDRTADGWRIRTDSGDRCARQVVIATGMFNRPLLPDWARNDDFPGVVVHAADYRNPAPFAGRDVLVVGAGSTGMEIAHDLAGNGASSVALAVRTPPNILLRTVAGQPVDLPVPLFLRLPPAMVDRMLQGMQRLLLGDLTAYGLPRPPVGPMAALQERGTGTAIVDRDVVDAVKDGRIRVVAPVDALEAKGARLRDGSLLTVDAVVIATGYDTGLVPLVGHLDVLREDGMPREPAGEEALPGLRFLGYTRRPGITGYVGRQARRVAPGIVARARASRPSPAGSRRPAWRRPTSRDRAASRG